ncbi:MAG: DUF2889 domain-containing protein [Gammaproteobacteria bacterium]|nr:DUF2889 domain-containing protein [Gammaproteobacteria bacterium]MDH3534776.1 DUF2889 domain-containing protein [Gammaproteobacteria bacterium]
MPLTKPVSRKLAHTRVVTCHGYQRDDGLLDIEGRIVDTKPYRFQNRDRGGWIEADEALHDMSIRLTLNLDLEVVDVDATIDASPYNYCKEVIDVARNLIGLRIEPGWTQKSKRAMGGNRGCTHLTELLGPVATTAIQTMASEKIRRDRQTKGKRKNVFLDSCHTYAADSPVVKLYWPEHYRGDSEP